LATGLFVEHYQNYDVQWNGNGGETIFFQSEMPYAERAVTGTSAVVADHAFEAPTGSGIHFHDLLTVSRGGGRRDRARHQLHRRGDALQHHPGGRHQVPLTRKS
jgi:hypothetical protein